MQEDRKLGFDFGGERKRVWMYSWCGRVEERERGSPRAGALNKKRKRVRNLERENERNREKVSF